jgi:hypothetical protein
MKTFYFLGTSVSFGATVVQKIWFHWFEKYSTQGRNASREPCLSTRRTSIKHEKYGQILSEK